LKALQVLGAPTNALGISTADLTQLGMVVQFGVPPNRIDLLTSISGVPLFATAWSSRVEQVVRDKTVPFLGRGELIVNKRASGRLKDLAYIESLGEKP